MMSKNELTSGEQDTVRRSKEPTVITTANGKAESTEQATVYVNNLDVFATMILLKDSPAVLSLDLFCEEMGYSYGWRRRESRSLIKVGQVLRCTSENHVPLSAVSKEPRVPAIQEMTKPRSS